LIKTEWDGYEWDEDGYKWDREGNKRKRKLKQPVWEQIMARNKEALAKIVPLTKDDLSKK
jgi:hypothetical protein